MQLVQSFKLEPRDSYVQTQFCGENGTVNTVNIMI